MSIVKIHGASAFDLLNVVANGDDPAAFLDYLSGLSVNTLRVFGMWSQGFDPTRVSADTYRGLVAALADLVIGRGFYLQFTFGTDQTSGSSILMPNSQTRELAAAAVDALRQFAPFILWQDWNEAEKNWNGESFETSGLMGCTSRLDDQPSIDAWGPFKQWGDLHTARTWDAERKAHDAYALSRANGAPTVSHAPTILTEPGQMGRDMNVRQCADYYALGDLHGAGAFMHHLDLEFCRISTDSAVLDCMAAIQDVWAIGIPPHLAGAGAETSGSVGRPPLVHRDRFNKAGDEVDPSGTLRTYFMDNWGVAVAPGRAYVPTPQDGHRIVNLHGRFQNVIETA